MNDNSGDGLLPTVIRAGVSSASCVLMSTINDVAACQHVSSELDKRLVRLLIKSRLARIFLKQQIKQKCNSNDISSLFDASALNELSQLSSS